VMLADRPLSIALRRRGLPAGSPPPALAATEISRMILVKILPRRASSAFLRASMEGPLPMENSLERWKGADSTLVGAALAPRKAIATQASLLQEPAFPQEPDGLGGGFGREQQAAVAAFDDDVVGDALEPGLNHRHGAIVLALEAGEQRAQAVRHAAGDHAHPRLALPAADSILQQPGTAAEQGRGRRPAQHPRGRPAPGRWRPQADDPRYRQRRRLAQRLPCDQPAEAVGDVVGRLPGLPGFDQPRHRQVGAIGDAVVAEDLRREAGVAQLQRQPVHRGPGHPQPVHQDHAAAGGHAQAPGLRRYTNSTSRTRPTGNAYSATLPKPRRA